MVGQQRYKDVLKGHRESVCGSGPPLFCCQRGLLMRALSHLPSLTRHPLLVPHTLLSPRRGRSLASPLPLGLTACHLLLSRGPLLPGCCSSFASPLLPPASLHSAPGVYPSLFIPCSFFLSLFFLFFFFFGSREFFSTHCPSLGLSCRHSPVCGAGVTSSLGWVPGPHTVPSSPPLGRGLTSPVSSAGSCSSTCPGNASSRRSGPASMARRSCQPWSTCTRGTWCTGTSR